MIDEDMNLQKKLLKLQRGFFAADLSTLSSTRGHLFNPLVLFFFPIYCLKLVLTRVFKKVRLPHRRLHLVPLSTIWSSVFAKLPSPEASRRHQRLRGCKVNLKRLLSKESFTIAIKIKVFFRTWR